MAEVITIAAKVAQVVSSTQLAFNVGTNKGVSTGDTVTLYRIVEVTDPDSGDILGSVRVPRLNLRVSLVDKKFCIADVTDQVSDNIYTSITLGRNVKKVTTSPSISSSESNAVVMVTIGEDAVIRHIEKGEE